MTSDQQEARRRLSEPLEASATEADPVARALKVSPRLIGMPRPILIEPADSDDSTPREPAADEEQPFYEALGRAVAMWQFIETSLVVVQQAADRSADRQKNAISFHDQQMFAKRLPLVEAALRRIESLGFWADQWAGYETRLKAAAVIRNRIAHALVYFDPARPLGRRIFLGVNLRNPKRWDEFRKGDKHFDAEALLRAAASFCHLHNELRGFAQHVTEEHDRLRRDYPAIFEDMARGKSGG